MSLTAPEKITDNAYRFDSFTNGKVLLNKKKNRLPAMGWNSWNAFGSGNTELLTKAMADQIVALGLDKLGYKYVVLDDGCYKSERINGKLENDEIKFPGGFKALADYIHSKNLKFGMYNDIGTNLCAGAAVGTCGHEKTDGKSYVDWGVDFLKIDNCYFLWDNATFSNPENAKYVYAPNIKSIIIEGNGFSRHYSVAVDGEISGNGVEEKDGYATNIGTFDGTNTGTSPVGTRSGELLFNAEIPDDGEYTVQVEYATGKENGTGCWLQLATGIGDDANVFFDDMLPETESKNHFVKSDKIPVSLLQGNNQIRIMNHRRQENTLCAYAAMLEGLNEADPDHDILLSICEWGKTQPQNWGYKVGDSWRILNDITFRVGSDGDAGFGEWNNPGTQSVCSQYNKAVIMDKFAGLDKGWNDPDMLMIGMNGLTSTMNRTHFAMWCMMNSPLMLGLDLRRVVKGDEIYEIITNKDLINVNQDSLGVQAKRIWSSILDEHQNPAAEYITDDERSDVIAKPLCDGSVAVSFINLSDRNESENFVLNMEFLKNRLGKKTPVLFKQATKYTVTDLWTKETVEIDDTYEFGVVAPCDNVTVRVTPRA
ncbi:glycoside hydrolase family 27 protein [Treponema sp.]|uniref:glycoside hydrolase family 27 protein n=1 Tax=Treponema sp. TaxID=166 RepID=UPI00298ECF97|nr:glycoside hydrolase family 27 protein [Treponema sp.]MCQ2241649.1 glycoside hydrolase family 27 protein [Treponema sp.]